MIKATYINKKQLDLLLRAVACTCALAAAFSLVSFASAAQQVRSGCIRLHILAQSDSEADQQLKLAVRDALLSCGSELLSGTVNIDTVNDALESSKELLQSTALKVIREQGFDYPVDIYLCREYFTTRSYGSLTMPAGCYTAVKVVIGSGTGHNWWCVMFPPLCLPGASRECAQDYLTGGGVKLTGSNPRFEPRFRIVEIYEYIADKINN